MSQRRKRVRNAEEVECNICFKSFFDIERHCNHPASSCDLREHVRRSKPGFDFGAFVDGDIPFPAAGTGAPSGHIDDVSMNVGGGSRERVASFTAPTATLTGSEAEAANAEYDESFFPEPDDDPSVDGKKSGVVLLDDASLLSDSDNEAAAKQRYDDEGSDEEMQPLVQVESSATLATCRGGFRAALVVT
jgi:hypothetical protein